ncbi:MAG: zinc-ribbon domain containing protein [Dehalococcoidia bacterium]
MAFQDKTLVCRECSSTFTFTAGEQEFYQSHGLLHEPARCPTCRAERRRAGSGLGRPRVMYQVECADCGTTTEVPFEPRLGRPVYCRDCFETHKQSAQY